MRYELPADDEIDPSEITICKRPDGSDWCLGGGQYGKVGDQGLGHACKACLCSPAPWNAEPDVPRLRRG